MPSAGVDERSVATESRFREAGEDLNKVSVTENPVAKAIVLGKTPDIHIPFNKPCIFPECMKAVQNAFDAGKVSGDGLNTQLCTEFFAARFGYSKTLFTPSCTAALEMAALILDVGPGDEVICPSFTFVSSGNAFALRGATLVFADSEKETPNMDVDYVLGKITCKTKAIVVVHYAGVPVNLTRLRETGIPIVEDCAHAIGSIDPVTNDFVGKTGCLATFSYHETKNIGIGEGGTLVVNDSNLWERARICREKGTNRTAFREGREAFYTWLTLGSSYLMSDVDAGVLWGCLQHYSEIQAKRLSVWDFYDENLWPSSLFKKPSKKRSKANAHMYYLQFYDGDTRQNFEKFMKGRGILVASHYKALDGSPFIQAKNKEPSFSQEMCTNAENWSNTLARLPLYFELSIGQLEIVAEAVNSFTGEYFGMVRNLWLHTSEACNINGKCHQPFSFNLRRCGRCRCSTMRLFVLSVMSTASPSGRRT